MEKVKDDVVSTAGRHGGQVPRRDGCGISRHGRLHMEKENNSTRQRFHVAMRHQTVKLPPPSRSPSYTATSVRHNKDNTRI